MNDFNNLNIAPTKSSPEITLDADAGLLRIRGESFPENASKFYAPVIEWIAEYFVEAAGRKTVFEIEIVYFNSSTSKVLMNLLDLADYAAGEGKDVSVHWICDEENETAIECGEEFKEDLTHVPFAIVIKKNG